MIKKILNNSRLKEGIRFILTGGVCFLVELALLIALRDFCGLDTLLAAAIAFTVSVIVNYIMCVLWVFSGAREQGNSEKMGFLITSLMGLALNELLMLAFRVIFGEDGVVLTLFGFTVYMYMVNKVLATALVMVWNYFTKRAILKNGILRRKKQ